MSSVRIFVLSVLFTLATGCTEEEIVGACIEHRLGQGRIDGSHHHQD